MTTGLLTKPKLEAIVIEKGPPFDLIIIGGGPAGISAAIYALRFGLHTLLIEKTVLGGLASTVFEIENYPGFPEGICGMELTKHMQDQAQKLGLQIFWGNVLKLSPEAIRQGGKTAKEGCEVEVDGKKLIAKAVIVASGTEVQKLGIPGEDKLRGRGVSYCATCDGPFYRDKNIIVVGGGNSAVEEALFLTRYASKVSIIHRRDALRADKILAERALRHPKIYFFWRSVVEEISGKDRVEEVVLKDLSTGKKIRVPVDGVFIYIGSRPNTEFAKDLIKLDEKGFILTDENMKTSAPGVFAAGDVRAKSLRQIVTAAADGAIAADSVRKYIDKLEGRAIL